MPLVPRQSCATAMPAGAAGWHAQRGCQRPTAQLPRPWPLPPPGCHCWSCCCEPAAAAGPARMPRAAAAAAADAPAGWRLAGLRSRAQTAMLRQQPCLPVPQGPALPLRQLHQIQPAHRNCCACRYACQWWVLRRQTRGCQMPARLPAAWCPSSVPPEAAAAWLCGVLPLWAAAAAAGDVPPRGRPDRQSGCGSCPGANCAGQHPLPPAWPSC